jgi:pimeloyl-ACP methyl ester carboxylesterase
MGFPVLALHRRGFGDSTGSLADATLDRQIEDVWAAAGSLARSCGTAQIGFIGGRFGGLLAVAAARRGGVDRLLLMGPSLNGEAYFTQTIREKSIVETARMDGSPRRSQADLVDELRRDGIIDVLGHPIYRELFEDVAALDLTRDVGRFAGDVLAIDVSKASKVSPHIDRFRDSVTANGGTCRVEHLGEPPRARFGGAAFVSTTKDPSVRVDVLKPLVERMSQITEEWLS